MVLVSKQEKRIIYQYFMREGVLVVKKNEPMELHEDMKVLNLKVQMTCKSMRSKGFLEQIFNWQYQYYNLTANGIRELCSFLGLPSNIRPDIYKPSAQKRQRATDERPRKAMGGFGRAPASRQE